MMMLTSTDLEVIKEVLHNNFATRTGREMIFDGHFFIGNKALCNRLDCFVISYQLAELRRFFTDELLIGRIIASIN